MQHIKIFIEFTRLNKPIGFMLLFWPCAWGLAYGKSFSQFESNFTYFMFLFFFGSVLMRSAGCIFNDIIDKDLDKRVSRTKLRPIASGKISVRNSLIYVFILCLLALCILLQFNFLTIALGMGSMIFAFAYPFMKRITYWPQLFLGLTFNWGLIMAWTALNENISLEIVLFYLAAIFWTLGYDTIYGAQDIIDDEIIGIKSTSIKFKRNIKQFVSTNYFLTFVILIYLFKDFIGINFFTFLFVIFFLSLIFQLLKFDKNKPKTCLIAFKTNNFSGMLLFLALIVSTLKL